MKLTGMPSLSLWKSPKDGLELTLLFDSRENSQSLITYPDRSGGELKGGFIEGLRL